MTPKKYLLRQLLGWVAAAVTAVLLCNGLLYAYHKYLGFLWNPSARFWAFRR